MDLWLRAHIQLFPSSASRSFYPVWDQIYICGWDHYKSFMQHKCNFKRLQVWRTRPRIYLLYSIGYGSCINSKQTNKNLSNSNLNIKLCNQHPTFIEEGLPSNGAKLWLPGCCFKILFLFTFKKIAVVDDPPFKCPLQTSEFCEKGTVFLHQNFMSLFARVSRKSKASTGQLVAWSSLSFSVLTLNLYVTDVRMLKMISTSEVFFFFLLKKNIMKMKAYVCLLSRKQLGAGCLPQPGDSNSVITGRGLKTIRMRNLELNPLEWCDQIKRDKGMWWSIIKSK